MEVCLAAAAFALMVPSYLLYEKHKENPTASIGRAGVLLFKALCTLTAAVLCLAGCLMKQSAAAADYLLFAGLCVCACADVVLDLSFLPGMGAFALGHLCYMAAYVRYAPPGVPSLIVFLALAALCLARYPALKRKYAGKFSVSTVYCLIYALVLCVMLALAVPQKPVLFFGAVLFVLSDALLATRMMREIKNKPYDYLCLGLYYLAQFLIGLSVMA